MYIYRECMCVFAFMYSMWVCIYICLGNRHIYRNIYRNIYMSICTCCYEFVSLVYLFALWICKCKNHNWKKKVYTSYGTIIILNSLLSCFYANIILWLLLKWIKGQFHYAKWAPVTCTATYIYSLTGKVDSRCIPQSSNMHSLDFCNRRSESWCSLQWSSCISF